MTRHELEALLSVGGKANSLGKVADVIATVLADKRRLRELYDCMFSSDAWVRMRAADAFEKICRKHPEWITPYIDNIQRDLSGPEQQASIKWHIAEIYMQVELSDSQQQFALNWLATQIKTINVDWIVSANCMKALMYFTKDNHFPKAALLSLLTIQKNHASKAVIKKASTFYMELTH